MNIHNPLYKNQGLHAILALFTVEDGKFKVLLIKRRNEPYKDKWILVGGACYNNETAEEGMDREIFIKTGIKKVSYRMFGVFSKPDRSPLMRMIAVAYVGVIDRKKVKLLRETTFTSDADWFLIDRVPELGYDHQEILEKAIVYLKTEIFDSTILKELFPETFTLPEVHKAYEGILNKQIDRRNFRKRLLSLQIIEDTGMFRTEEKKKPAKLYRFNPNRKKVSVL